MAHFTFEEKPYWRPVYAEGMDVLLAEIPVLLRKMKIFTDELSNASFVNGFLTEYRRIYIFEICSGENKNMTEIIDGRLTLRDDIDHRNKKKVVNLRKAVRYAFGDRFTSDSYRHDLTVDFAKKLNKKIGDGLFSNAGNYRKYHAKPSGYNFFYLEPFLIDDHMNELFDYMGKEIEKELEWMDWIELAAKFFEKFLQIHPFSNGNGRTARILLSSILIKKTIVPVSLFSSSFRYSSNIEYLHCLEEAHAFENNNLLNSLIIESIHRVCNMFLNMLDVENKN